MEHPPPPPLHNKNHHYHLPCCCSITSKSLSAAAADSDAALQKLSCSCLPLPLLLLSLSPTCSFRVRVSLPFLLKQDGKSSFIFLLLAFPSVTSTTSPPAQLSFQHIRSKQICHRCGTEKVPKKATGEGGEVGDVSPKPSGLAINTPKIL